MAILSKQQSFAFAFPPPGTVSLKSSEDGVKKSMLFEFEERVSWILDDKRHFSVRSVPSLIFGYFLSRESNRIYNNNVII